MRKIIKIYNHRKELLARYEICIDDNTTTYDLVIGNYSDVIANHELWMDKYINENYQYLNKLSFKQFVKQEKLNN